MTAKIPNKNIIAAWCLIISSGIMLHSCFTGIESTPKITAGDVKRERIEIKPEDTYLADIKPQPVTQWQQGKRFYVADNKINLLLGASGTSTGDLRGQFLSFKQISEVTSITGKKVAEFTFITESGHEVTYRTDQQLRALEQAQHMEIPFTVEMSVVEAVKNRMNENTYYVVTSSWYDTRTEPRSGHRFVPVTVTDVKPGNSFYQILLELNDENGQPFRLLMSIGEDLKAPRKFASLFSLTDPRLRYPDITDANWHNIINGRVAEEMTRDECRLALGSPATIDRRPGYSIMREIWTYENGIYLIFEDGLLRSFRQ